jgi:BirA family biotin operon repressor/biotin-[acetyl-CoA-carboxylase] ligase
MSESLPQSERVNPRKVKELIKTRILGRRGLYLREVTSTNDIARGLATEGANEGLIVVSELQAEGRGRRGREWTSPVGGLWFSVILRPKVHARHVAKLGLLASVAVAKAICRLYGLETSVKWPNDVLLVGKKVCGILTEGEIRDQKIGYAVLGIGVNADFNVQALPVHVRQVATTLRHQLKKEIEREVLLSELLKEIEFQYNMFEEQKFDVILEDWRSLASFLGSDITVQADGEIVQGLAVGINNDGALVVRLGDGTMRSLTSGDITAVSSEQHPEHVDE